MVIAPSKMCANTGTETQKGQTPARSLPILLSVHEGNFVETREILLPVEPSTLIGVTAPDALIPATVAITYPLTHVVLRWDSC